VNIIVCVKRVPEASEAEIAIDKSGKSIRTEDLVFDIVLSCLFRILL
jgi:electron transfer flavoprotein alpha/beta subunit